MVVSYHVKRSWKNMKRHWWMKSAGGVFMRYTCFCCQCHTKRQQYGNINILLVEIFYWSHKRECYAYRSSQCVKNKALLNTLTDPKTFSACPPMRGIFSCLSVTKLIIVVEVCDRICQDFFCIFFTGQSNHLPRVTTTDN